MPINPTTLKASIDTQITNETVDFAITPSEVGGRMKDCVDYTTEQAALKENLITATTSAQYYRGDKTFATLNKAAVNLANVDNTSDVNKPISTATQVALDLKEDLINPTTSAQYYRGDKTFATLNKAAVNLASVDNTSDANKPISIATQTALNSKQNTLVSGTNIKTINGASVLGSGDLVIGSSLPYLESSFKVNQSGTSNPTASNYFIDQVRISPSDNTNPLYRNLTFERTAIGEFNIKILWLTGSASAVNITKLDMSIGDGNIKLTSSSNGTLGSFSYIQQNINVYNASGTLSDNEFYTNFYIRLFS
jgi:hypothetical protein